MLMFLTKCEQKRNDLYVIFCDQFGIIVFLLVLIKKTENELLVDKN